MGKFKPSLDQLKYFMYIFYRPDLILSNVKLFFQRNKNHSHLIHSNLVIFYYYVVKPIVT